MDFVSHYAAASDDRLLQWTADVANLVPSARVALRAEVERRNLSIPETDWEAQPVSEPAKVSGWILVYCFGALFIYPIWMIVNWIKQPLLGLVFLPHSIFVIGSGVLLWKKDSRGLAWVRRGYLYLIALFAVGLIFSISAHELLTTADYVIDLTIGSIPLVLWWFYFRRSKSVLAIYGVNMRGFFKKS